MAITHTPDEPGTAAFTKPVKALSRLQGRLPLSLLVALVVGSILGSGIFGLPQNMAAGAGAGAILIGWLITGVGMLALAGVVANNAEHGVNWVHSYVNPERTQTFCIYDAPTPESIRKVADRNGLPVGRITEVKVLDPYFYAP